MNLQMKKMCLIVIGIILAGFGSASCLKANIGVDAWDALGKSLSDISGIKIGTVGMGLNLLCFFGQIALLGKQFKKVQLLQIPVSIALGFIVNFFFYDVFSIFELESYGLRIAMFVGAVGITAFGIAIVMLIDEVTFALEGFCMAIANRWHKRFHLVRQGADGLCVIFITIVTLISGIAWSIGFGTILGLLIFGPMIGFFMRLLKPILESLKLIKISKIT